MQFTKYNGLGNDFVFVNTFKQPLQNPSRAAKILCDRRRGIGADGLILIGPSAVNDVRMRVINADGSEAQMCGNASRCVPFFVREQGILSKSELTLETLAGPIHTKIMDEAHRLVTVDMGVPRLLRGQIPMAGDPADFAIDIPLQMPGDVVYGTAVSMGNPHFVMFGPDAEHVPVEVYGPQVESHPLFPQKTNVEFVTVLDANTLRMRVWERGAGITQACGTGACASVVAAVINGKTNRQVTVLLDGGALQINWPEQKHIFMTGPAEKTFTGTWEKPL